MAKNGRGQVNIFWHACAACGLLPPRSKNPSYAPEGMCQFPAVQVHAVQPHHKLWATLPKLCPRTNPATYRSALISSQVMGAGSGGSTIGKSLRRQLSSNSLRFTC